MSVLDRLKSVSSAAEELTKDKPKIVLKENTCLVAEGYASVKLFGEDSMILEFEEFDLHIEGTNLYIESFSPMKLILWGNIESLTYSSGKVSWEEL